MATFSLSAEEITTDTDINVALFQTLVNGINEALSYQFSDNLYLVYDHQTMTSSNNVEDPEITLPLINGSTTTNYKLQIHRYRKAFTVQSYAPTGYQFDLSSRPFIAVSVGTGAPFIVNGACQFQGNSNNSFDVVIDRLNTSDTGFQILIAAPVVAQ